MSRLPLQDISQEKPKVLYHTFGCKLNFAETASLQTTLEGNGYVTLSASELSSAEDQRPDIILINSCSVTEVADKKCRQYIRSLNRRYPSAKIVVTGCYAQLKPAQVASLPGVNLVVGTQHKGALPQLIESLESESIEPHIYNDDIETFVPSCARGERTRFFLKVQDGCDYRCSYCTIPKARGKSRSPQIADLVEQARRAAEQGGREIVLTGVNIGDFGRTSGQTFLELIKELDKVEGIDRFRISSIEPNLLTDSIIEFCAASQRFMPHFHIPLQSGSDSVLALMRRRYKSDLFRHKIEKIRQIIPDAFIGVDIIAGSRGETREFFEESANFVESLDISKLHVFAYSERPGTDALKIPLRVDPAEQAERVARLIAISNEKLKNFTSRFIGTSRKVLLEHGLHAQSAEIASELGGFTDNYIRVKINKPLAHDNTIVEVRLESISPDGQFVNGLIV